MSTHVVDHTVLTEQHLIVRTRTFRFDRADLHSLVGSLLLALEQEHATGKFIVNLSQGRPGSIQFEESQRLAP